MLIGRVADHVYSATFNNIRSVTDEEVKLTVTATTEIDLQFQLSQLNVSKLILDDCSISRQFQE
jgi:hypothetical protein